MVVVQRLCADSAEACNPLGNWTVVTTFGLVRAEGSKGGEGGDPGFHFMCGFAGQCRQLVIAQRIEFAEAVLFKGVEKLLVPNRI